MDASAIIGKVSRGYAIAGGKLGPAHALYRPTGTGPALAPANRVGALAFSASATMDAAFKRPATREQAAWAGLFDASLARVGDYVDGPSGTWFVAELGTLAAPVVMRCNAVVSFARPGRATQAGVNPYGGRTTSTDAPLAAGWPASVLLGGSGGASTADLPRDARNAGFEALLPLIPGVVPRQEDVMSDDAGRRFLIGAVETTRFGLRLAVSQLGT